MEGNNKLVLVLGDSIMFGSGNGGVGVGEYLAGDMGFKVAKYAVGGARVGFRKGKSWLIEQIRQVLKDKITPDLIVFDGFTNDCNISEGAVLPDVPLGDFPQGYTGKDISEITETDDFSTCFDCSIKTLLTAFPKAKLLFIRPHNMGRRDDVLQKQYGERALALCSKWGVPFVDLYSRSGMNTFIPEHRDLFTFDSYGWGRGDCTHPNETGYKLKYMPLIEAAIKEL